MDFYVFGQMLKTISGTSTHSEKEFDRLTQIRIFLDLPSKRSVGNGFMLKNVHVISSILLILPAFWMA